MSKESNSAVAEKSGGIIEENLTTEQMEELYENSMKLFKEGEVTSGTVIAISNDKVVVDVGFKSEGIISAFEFPGGADSVNIGDTVEVFIDQTENQDGVMILSVEKAARLRKWDAINKIYESGNTIKGKVIGKIKGGLTVDIGLRAFLPGSQIDLRPPKNMDEFLGREYEYKIIKMNKRRGNIVLSRRAIIEEERKASKSETLSNLEEGAIVSGIVKNITDYGAFIDLGGVDGLLHITDMSWGRINHPSEILTVGQTAKVIVLKFDTETERVSLGLKQQSEDPWENIEEKYSIGTNIKGKVVSITDYGAFLELENGVEGLVHISEMTWSKHVRHPSRIVNPGDEVEAEVLNIDKERKRISLGMKQVSTNPWENIEERYPVNSVIEGTVRNLTDFGAFVEIEDGVDGLIHISDMSWTAKIKHPSEVVKKKDRVKAKVLKIDKDGERISLGLKQLEPDPWETVADKYKMGQEISVTIVKVTNFGAFAEIEPGIEGLIHVSQISEDATDARKELTIGSKCEVKVIKVDAESRKIGLSMKDGPIDAGAVDETDFETEDFPEEE